LLRRLSYAAPRMLDLRKRRLGTTDFSITTVGFGAWAIGGSGWAYGWSGHDDAASVAAIVQAVSRGLNWLDTAAIYGLGHSEEVVGRALREIPTSERPLLFTKCGLLFDPADRQAMPTRNLTPASIRRELEASLRRLGVDHVDLYQFHWPDTATGTPVEESWGELGRLLEEGKIRAAGVSNFSVELLERAEAVRHVDALQPPFSLLEQGSGNDVIPWAAAHGTGVIVYSPLQSGILTNSFSAERARTLPADDWRRRSEHFQEPALSRNVALRDALRPIARRHGTSVSAIAIAWTTAFPGVTAAIAGARTAEQVDGWLDAARLELSSADLAEIRAALGQA
jgi:aryl-alcohol dehydrogenase-like predicted oxidoreductase